MSTKDPSAIGRPSIFSQELADAILTRVGDGRGLSEVCRDDDMPNRAAVYRWLAEDEAFRRQYAVACDMRAELLNDGLINIADTAALEDTQRARLMIDARKWVMAKLSPKKYGDKVLNEHSGPDGAEIPMRVITDVDRGKALAALMARLKASAPAAD